MMADWKPGMRVRVMDWPQRGTIVKVLKRTARIHLDEDHLGKNDLLVLFKDLEETT